MFILFVFLCFGVTVNGIDLSSGHDCSTTPCAPCHGACTADEDCENGYCYDGHEDVPGCTGTGVVGQKYCATFKRLSRILSSTPSVCNSDSELEIWANVGIQGAETFAIATESWKTTDFEVTGTLDVTGTLSLPANSLTGESMYGVTTHYVRQHNQDGVYSADGWNNVGGTNMGKSAWVFNTEVVDVEQKLKVGGGASISGGAAIAGGASIDGDTSVSDSITIGDSITAADGAFHVKDEYGGGTISDWATLTLKGHLYITDSPKGSQTDGNFDSYNCAWYLRDWEQVGSADNDKTHSGCNWKNYRVAIDAEDAILAGSYIGASDRRIKKNIRALNDHESLDILRKLDTKSYQYIDQIKKGESEVIGFIAQDVKNAIPAAVSTRKQIIPNEMRKISASFKKTSKDKWKMMLDKALEPGTYRFKVITLDEKSQETLDLSTTDGKTFEVEQAYKRNVFLYGKEVDDFLTIDKQKIFAVAYSALQQVDKNQQTLTERVAKLEQRSAKHWEVKKEDKIIKALEDKITKLEERLSQLEK